ncbi:MAG: glycosyltransferase, partial [Gemmatimonadaceae bacterium]
GAAVAIGAAHGSGYPLLLVGEAYDAAYTEEHVLPYARCRPEWREEEPLDAPVTWIGARPRHVVHRLMATATATLVPSRWEEPFGLAAVEAQAAGCPAIAFDRGGLHDVIADGRTGVLVPPDDEIAFARAIPVAARLDRAACRAWVADRFSMATTIVAHEALYRRVVAASA